MKQNTVSFVLYPVGQQGVCEKLLMDAATCSNGSVGWNSGLLARGRLARLQCAPRSPRAQHCSTCTRVAGVARVLAAATRSDVRAVPDGSKGWHGFGWQLCCDAQPPCELHDELPEMR